MDAENPPEGLVEPKEKLVLIVDDDDGAVDLLKLLVGRDGFRTVVAKSGAEALRKVEETTPDLAVLDLMLPGMGGYEIVRQLQAMGVGGMPVIITSARVMDPKMVRTLTSEPNVRGFFPKPPQPLPFCDRLHTLLGTRRPR